jgi:hypothetical protein
MANMELRRECLLAAVVCVVVACGESPRGRTYYERNIEPILLQKCAGNTSGCHAINTDDPFAVAAGNLDVTSFENVQKRRDALTPFGAYPYPLMLIKAVGPGRLTLQYGPAPFKSIDVQHSGGGLVEVGSDAYFTLQTWLDNGATENGLRPATPAVAGTGACSEEIPAGFDAAAFDTKPGFDTFKSTVQPILERHGCNVGSCHGAPQSDFFLTCGTTEDQRAFNFSQAWAFLNDPVDDSQLLRVPLAAGGGGRGHTGGDQFPSNTDGEYLEIRNWAESVITASGVRDFAGADDAKIFFRDHVQRVLVQRGCAFQACHSPQATNDFKLRSGSVGFFSAVALQKNYDLLRDEFMALEFPDARRGRAVAKSILDDDPRITGPAGIAHRGGAVLETPGTPADPADPVCLTFDPATSTAFCTVQEWLRRERLAVAGQVTSMDSGQTVPVVYVDRPSASVVPERLDFDAFRGGAELRVVTATFAANNSLAPIDDGASTLLSANCNLANGDIQAPNVANDGDRVVFAGRATAAEPLGIYIASISTGACQRITPPEPDSNGLKVHNFDPVFAPDGTFVVFASTRGKAGAIKSRKRFFTQSDLWRIPVNGLAADGAPEQMTFLSNSELAPGFMREGRVTMTTEKVSAGFYQLSGRRINWDLTDYHPLLAQRKDSLYVDPTMQDLTTTNPSIGFSSATDVREASNGDFLVILADNDMVSGAPAVASGAGALGVFNRSIGPFEQGRVDIAYVRALRIVGDARATGREGSNAGYRRPVSLPDGTIMAAFSANASAGTFDIHSVDPRTNASDSMFTTGPAAGRARVDAVMAFKHPPRELYANRRQLVFGGAADASPQDAIVHIPDAPMTFTVLVANLRRGRPLVDFDRATQLAVYSEGVCGANCSPGAGGIFESRALLGTAPLADDGSVKVLLPSATGLVFELQDSAGNVIVTMGEEHQLGPGERISLGVSRTLFNGVCGGCHGSITGQELDVAVTPDALTGASASASQDSSPAQLKRR